MSVSYSAYQPSGQLGSKLEHVIITFQKNEIPLFGRAVEVVGWQSIFIVILCTLKQRWVLINPLLFMGISIMVATVLPANAIINGVFDWGQQSLALLLVFCAFSKIPCTTSSL